MSPSELGLVFPHDSSIRLEQFMWAVSYSCMLGLNSLLLIVLLHLAASFEEGWLLIRAWSIGFGLWAWPARWWAIRVSFSLHFLALVRHGINVALVDWFHNCWCIYISFIWRRRLRILHLICSYGPTQAHRHLRFFARFWLFNTFLLLVFGWDSEDILRAEASYHRLRPKCQHRLHIFMHV